MNKQYLFYKISLILAVIVLAVPAAYFSVFGLSKLYIGAGIAGIVLFSGIEYSKIVAISYLYKFWKIISWARKIYLTLAIIVAMTLTSVGIYGFLSAAFQSTSTSIELINNQVQIIENKKDVFNKRIDNIQEQAQFRTDRVTKLSDLRTQQEIRLDTLYQRGNFSSAKATENNIKETNTTIDKLNGEILKLNNEVASINDSLSTCDIKIMELNNNQYQHDLGPLKYVSELTNIPMNKIVNILTIIIIFIFDPFAIALLIAFNHIIMISKRKEEEKEEEKEEKEEEKEEIPKIKSRTKEKIQNIRNSLLMKKLENYNDELLKLCEKLEVKNIEIEKEKTVLREKINLLEEKIKTIKSEPSSEILSQIENKIIDEMQEKMQEKLDRIVEELDTQYKNKKPPKKVVFDIRQKS